MLHADVRLAGPRGDVPVDLAHVVAERVRADLRELASLPEEPRAVVAREQPFHPPRDRDLERAQQALGDRPGTGLIRAAALRR